MILLATAALAQDVFIRDARLVDARGEVAREADILVREGRIAAVGALDAPAGVEVIEGKGHTVVPGLIDTHVHISMAPSSAWVGTPPEGVEARRDQHLRGLLAWGVTTIVDPGVTIENARAMQTWLEAGHPAPRVVWLGPLLSPEGGYVAEVIPEFPPAPTPADVVAQIDGFDVPRRGVKFTLEQGLVFPIWNLHDQDVRDATVAACAERDLDLYVHAMHRNRYRDGLAMAPHAFVHGPDKRLTRGLLRKLVDTGSFVQTTLAVPRSQELQFETERFDDPHVVATVPEDERLFSRDRHAEAMDAVGAALAPGMPEWIRKPALKVMGGPRPWPRGGSRPRRPSSSSGTRTSPWCSEATAGTGRSWPSCSTAS